MRIITTVMSLVLAGTLALAAEVEFKVAPTATRADGKVVVSFELSRPADVEVAIVDAKGKVVRHVAAGVLGGKNPPPAPLRPGLAQSLIWAIPRPGDRSRSAFAPG